MVNFTLLPKIKLKLTKNVPVVKRPGYSKARNNWPWNSRIKTTYGNVKQEPQELNQM